MVFAKEAHQKAVLNKEKRIKEQIDSLIQEAENLINTAIYDGHTQTSMLINGTIREETIRIFMNEMIAWGYTVEFEKGNYAMGYPSYIVIKFKED